MVDFIILGFIVAVTTGGIVLHLKRQKKKKKCGMSGCNSCLGCSLGKLIAKNTSMTKSNK